MAKYQGIVNVVTAKDFPARERMAAATLHGFALKGMDGFFGLGKSAHPLVVKGAEIEFEANEKRVVDRSSVRLAGNIQPYAVVGRPDSPPISGPVVKSAYQAGEAARQKSIAWQSGRKDAIEVVDLMLRNGAMTLPKKGQEAILAHVDELTLRFFQDTLDVENQPSTRRSDQDKHVGQDGEDDSFGEA